MTTKNSLDAVFKFVLHRPPKKSATKNHVEIARDTEFQRQLKEMLNEESQSRYFNVASLAQKHNREITAPVTVSGLKTVTAIKKALKLIEDSDDLSLPLTSLVQQSFETEITELSESNDIQTDLDILSDVIVAAKFSPKAEVAQDLLTAAGILQAIVNEDDADTKVASILSRPFVFGDPVLNDVIEMISPPKEESAIENTPDIVDQVKNYNTAIQELKSLDKLENYNRFDVQDLMEPEISATIESPTVLSRFSNLFSINRFRKRTVATQLLHLRSEFTPYILKTDSIESVTSVTSRLLSENFIDLAEVSLPEAVNQLAGRRNALSIPPIFLPPIILFNPSIPTTKGRIRPAGIADLHIVRQQIKSYVGGEVAHIENVLAGEKKTRDHRRLDRTETLSTLETEVTTEEERETQTTERFEMQSETSRTINEDASAKAGLTVSGSYGPSVSFTASGEISASTSVNESKRAATTYAKDIMDRSLSKIVNKTKTIRTTTRISEIEEKNIHLLNGREDGKHISGVYQWVDKVYEAQVMNYGKRLLFDFVIPEPAAFLWSLMGAPTSTDTLPPPIEQFRLTPDQIQPDNYNRYVSLYGAVDVAPPPPEYAFVSKAFAAPKNDDRDDPIITVKDSINIPTGFEATMFSSHGKATTWDDLDHRQFMLVVGDVPNSVTDTGGVISFPENEFATTSALVDSDEGLSNALPVAIAAVGYDSFALTVLVKCNQTEFAMTKWKHDTYQKIREAFELKQAEWENRVATILDDQAAGIQINGRNPKENRKIELNELKRVSIEMLSEQRFDLFNAVSNTPGQVPVVDFEQAEKEGQYIRFFENTFEWDQLTFSLYPYFWGRKLRWADRLLSDDLDPLHKEFLQAGAARVLVPVRPEFRKAIIHFLETGQIWNGEDAPPDVTSPLYVSIVDEFKNKSENFDTEEKIGEPWDVVVPTTLVKLRENDELPSWHKNEDGDWVSSDGPTEV